MTFACRAHCAVSVFLLTSSLLSSVAVAQSSAHGVAASQEVASAVTRATMESVGPSETIHIIVGQSLMLKDTSSIRRIYVGNPAIVQTYASAPDEVLVTAKLFGVSSLVLWDATGKVCFYNVSVDIDPSGLRQSLDAAYPNTGIDVQGVGDRLSLVGTVPTAEMSDGMAKMALTYSKDVSNSLRVIPVHGKQVQLKLRILEVDRSKAEQFGINIFRPTGNTIGGATTGQFPSTVTTTPPTSTTPATVATSNPLNLFLYTFDHNFGITMQDLESKNVYQVLAEPTLTAMSGQPAHFLSGGEFPYPVVQGGTGNSTAITIQFRSYGVKVDFTPTVNLDGTIQLKISPEVSTLDYTNAVTISGFTIPALATRRAETQVELNDGQTFVLSGLLDNTTTQNLSRMPGIANIPILGQLFKSKNINHAITELVVMVTVTVIDPLNGTAPQATIPRWVVPNMGEDDFDRQMNNTMKNGAPR
jgi:pilus assembly protein CpaC